MQQSLTLEQTADYLEAATIENSIDSGCAITHIGTSPSGVKFILTNDAYGCTALTESM